MSLDQYERSRHDGSRFELFRFETEDNINLWTYTTDRSPFTWNLITYVPEAIQRGEIKQSNAEGSGQRMEISLPWDNPVAQIHVPYLPPRPVRVTVYAVQRRDTSVEVKQCFVGYITTFSQDGPMMKFQCSHIIDSQQQTVPWVVHKSGCVWAVYGEGCGVLQALYESQVPSGEYTISGDSITSPVFAAKAAVEADWFRSGKIYNPVTGERRFITDHQGDTIKLVYPFIGVNPANTNLVAAAGCARTPGVCASKFGNKENYLGFDHMPDYNVFNGGVR